MIASPRIAIPVLLWLGGCVSASAPTSQEVETLISSIDAGDERQMDLAVSLLPRLGGGNLEDTMRALGAASAHHPLEFLRIVKVRDLDRKRVAAIVRMLPLSSVDDDEQKRRLVEERIAALSGVTDQHLREVRDMTVRILEDYQRELR